MKNKKLYATEYEMLDSFSLQNNVDYVKDYEALMIVVERIDVMSTKLFPINFIIANGKIEVKIFDVNTKPITYLFSYSDLYANNKEEKKWSLFKAVVKTVEWISNNPEILFNSKNAYCSPYFNYIKTELIESRFPTNTEQKVLIQKICKVFNCTIDSFYSKTRKRNVVIARQLFMTIMSFDLKHLGNAGALVGKDHATVLHSKKKIKEIFDTNDFLYYKQVRNIFDHFQLDDLVKS